MQTMQAICSRNKYRCVWRKPIGVSMALFDEAVEKKKKKFKTLIEKSHV